MGKSHKTLLLLSFLTHTAFIAEASAQTYYARTKLHVVRTDASVPTVPDGPPAQWSTGNWSSWSSTCSANAVRTRPVSCQAGGETVDDGQCAAAERPEASESDGIYTGCTEMVTDGAFRNGLYNWAWGNAGITQTGGSDGNVANLNGSGGYVTQTTLPLVAGRRYALSAMCVSSVNTGNRCNMGYSVTAGGKTLLTGTHAQSSRINVKIALGTVTGTDEPAVVRIYGTASASHFYLDNVSLVGS